MMASTSYTDITFYEQLKQLQIEIDALRRNNEALKISGQELLKRAPPLINIPHRSNMIQETVEDIIQKQEKAIQRLRDEVKCEKSQCLIAIDELKLKCEKQLNKFVERSLNLR